MHVRLGHRLVKRREREQHLPRKLEDRRAARGRRAARAAARVEAEREPVSELLLELVAHSSVWMCSWPSSIHALWCRTMCSRAPSFAQPPPPALADAQSAASARTSERALALARAAGGARCA